MILQSHCVNFRKKSCPELINILMATHDLWINDT